MFRCKEATGPLDTPCMIWTGYIDVNGYGVVHSRKNSRSVHRELYIFLNGMISNDIEVHHKCHNPSCCNPEHLEAMDKKAHRRLPKAPGYRNHHSAKTHCIHGHEYTPENTYLRPYSNGIGRTCKECSRITQRRKTIQRQNERKQQQQPNSGYSRAEANQANPRAFTPIFSDGWEYRISDRNESSVMYFLGSSR